jgi:hypothetical protein
MKITHGIWICFVHPIHGYATSGPETPGSLGLACRGTPSMLGERVAHPTSPANAEHSGLCFCRHWVPGLGSTKHLGPLPRDLQWHRSTPKRCHCCGFQSEGGTMLSVGRYSDCHMDKDGAETCGQVTHLRLLQSRAAEQSRQKPCWTGTELDSL